MAQPPKGMDKGMHEGNKNGKREWHQADDADGATLSTVRASVREEMPLLSDAPSAQAADSQTVSPDSVLLFLPSPHVRHGCTWTPPLRGWHGN